MAAYDPKQPVIGYERLFVATVKNGNYALDEQ
jgi:hypothetical protein